MESAAEEIIQQFNSSVFLKEFTFFPKEIKKSKAMRELTDGLIWLGDSAIFFQIKERGKTPQKPSESRQIKWFDKNVLGDAVRQMMGSLRTFETSKEVDFWNLRNQQRVIRYSTLKKRYYIILYHSRYSPFPRECLSKKFYRDEVTGRFIHIMSVRDWLHLCRYLITIPEIILYLDFRKNYLSLIMNSRAEKEKWLLGRFLRSPKVPAIELDSFAIDYTQFVDNLQIKSIVHKKFKSIVRSLYDRLDPVRQKSGGYYEMMLELASLNRKLQERFINMFERAERGELKSPEGFINTSTGAGFVFISGSSKLKTKPYEERILFVEGNTLQVKYLQQIGPCLGCCCYPDSESFDYVFFSSKWPTEDPEQLEKFINELDKKGAIPKSRHVIGPMYTFRQDKK